MQRIAFQLRVKADKLEEYDRAHQAVWPELLAELERFGVRDYSIFRREQQLFLFLRVPNFERLLHQLAQSEVNQRWQRTMAPLFEAVPGIQPGETFAMMREVFHMPGAVTRDSTLTGTKDGTDL